MQCSSIAARRSTSSRLLGRLSSRRPRWTGHVLYTEHPMLTRGITGPHFKDLGDQSLQKFESNSYPKNPSDPAPNPVSRQFMIATLEPQSTTQQDVLAKLSKFVSVEKQWAVSEHLPAAVILATPTFATWLEDASFMSKLLGVVFSNAVNLRLIVAVVDALPSASQQLKSSDPASLDGFAFLYGEQQHILPGLKAEVRQEDQLTSDESIKSSIVFSMRRPRTRMSGLNRDSMSLLTTSQSQHFDRVDISLPLANTVFNNGRPSTLLVQQWRKRKAVANLDDDKMSMSVKSEDFYKSKQYEKNFEIITPSELRTIESTAISVPLVGVTPARKISSGLGNIVRQIVNKDNALEPASRELEASVESFLLRKGKEKQAVKVWALVIDPSFVDHLRGPLHMVNDDTINLSDTSIAKEYIEYWLERGAGLHRVLSGGGGWGAKAGLLSLDPETTLAQTVSARYDTESYSFGYEEDELDGRLGHVAKPGLMIQFFIADDKIHLLQSDDASYQPPSTKYPVVEQTTIGCVPSTIDDMPSQPTQDDMLAQRVDQIHIIDGLFGALSEGGIFFRSSNESPDFTSMSTKVDVPYATYTQRNGHLAQPYRPGKLPRRKSDASTQKSLRITSRENSI